MKFPSKLVSGRLIKRYKRFLADVELDSGDIITTTCPNTGSMLGLTEPGSRVWLSTSDNPKRKYKHTWEMIEAGLDKKKAMVGINTQHPNKLVAEGLSLNAIPELEGYERVRREVKYGKNSRIDLLLDQGDDSSAPPCYVEIKNVHLLREKGLAEFPDSKTERGVKHLAELTQMVADGARAVMFYLIQRADADRFKIAADIDPAYGAAFEDARRAGVEMFAYRCRLTPTAIKLDQAVPIVFEP